MAYQGYQPPYQARPPPPPQPQHHTNNNNNMYYQPPGPAPPPHAVPPPSSLYPPAQPTVEQFRMDYARRLSQLTFNSRPIIQDLSILAMQERDRKNWEKMNVIVQEIEGAVHRAPPHAKLPVLYLVDSISKNVGSPFTTHLFPYIIHRMFLNAYREVDGVTKSKMEEMINLWRTSGPDGGDLYGPQVRVEVERDIFGSNGPPPMFQQHHPQHQHQQGVYPTRERVLQTIHATMEAKHRESAARPWDSEPRSKIDALQKILAMISQSQVPPHQLQQIMDTLQAMNPAVAAPAPAPPPPVQQYHAPPPQSYYAPPQQVAAAAAPGPPPPPSASLQPPTPNLPPFPPRMPHDSYRSTPRPGPSLAKSHTPPPPSGGSTPTPAPAIIPENVAALIRNLNTAGLAGIASAPRTPETNSVNLEKAGSATSAGLAQYEDMILTMNVRLEALDMNKMTSLPISHMPQKCTQCGVRFSDVDGVMQAHLDWHFRRNRKQRESEGRGAHRRWLPRVEEWIHDYVTSNEAGPSSRPADSGSSGVSKLTSDRIAQLRKKRVRVPSDPAISARPCPICKEAFKAEWSEEDEEWVWMNAIDINEKRPGETPSIYHAVCRAEQMSARVANRLLKDGGDGRRINSKSPRLTPGLDVKPSTPVPMETSTVKVEPNDGVTPPVNGDSVNGSAPPSTGKRKAEEEFEGSAIGTEEGEAKRIKVEELKTGQGSTTDVVNGDGSTMDDSSGLEQVRAEAVGVQQDGAREKGGETGDEREETTKESQESVIDQGLVNEPTSQSQAADEGTLPSITTTHTDMVAVSQDLDTSQQRYTHHTETGTGEAVEESSERESGLKSGNAESSELPVPIPTLTAATEQPGGDLSVGSGVEPTEGEVLLTAPNGVPTAGTAGGSETEGAGDA